MHGDISQPETLPAALRGVDLVISTISGDTLWGQTGEIVLARAAKAAGVKRFIPSQFGIDSHDFKLGEVPFIDVKVKTLDELRNLGLDFIVVSTNVWIEFSLGFNFWELDVFHSDTVTLPGDGTEYESLPTFPADIFVSLAVSVLPQPHQPGFLQGHSAPCTACPR